MSAEANENRRVTNVLGGMKFRPSFITGTLVPNRSPASIVAASPLRSIILGCLLSSQGWMLQELKFIISA